jgi:hypothetical protein
METCTCLEMTDRRRRFPDSFFILHFLSIVLSPKRFRNTTAKEAHSSDER